MVERTLRDSSRLAVTLALAFALAASALVGIGPGIGSVRAVAEGQKVVIIVGPVGSLTSNYRSRGDSIAQAAEALGATVVKVYSPDATWANVLAAVNGANIIVYLGHGNGFPNPYSGTLYPEKVDGWGLNRVAGVDPNDPTGDGDSWSTNMVYCGEAALEGKPLPSGSPQSTYCSGGPIRPASNFVMVYSNACYAPGAGETESTTPTNEQTALARVNNFSRPILALGGTYFASDLGSRSVVEAVLENPTTRFGDIFKMGNGYSASALRMFPHASIAGAETWIQRTQGPGGLWSYWYAFAGNPYQTPQPTAPITNFSATPTAGLLQLTVSFSNRTATYGPTSWAWDFDSDGTVDSAVASPTYTYPAAGTYTVTLTATNSLGTDTETKAGYVTVTTPQPSTYFAVSPSRLLDTRVGNGLSGPFTTGTPQSFQVGGRGGVPANAVAVTGNLTVTGQSRSGYVYLGPDPLPNPPSSTLNFPLGDDRANGVTVALGPGGTLSATYLSSSAGTAHLIFDVTGYYVAAN